MCTDAAVSGLLTQIKPRTLPATAIMIHSVLHSGLKSYHIEEWTCTGWESYVAGAWHRPSGDGRPLLDAATGEAVAELSPAGIDLASAVAYGRDTGGRRCGS